jgi:exopolysaccharide production protein ExoQ
VSPSLASLICACAIAGLFYLGRDSSVHTSKALWLPVVYLWMIGSRPISVWLGVLPPAGTNAELDGSPLDALVFGLLLAATVVVLIRRGRRVLTFLNTNWPILIYFFYCLVSVSWSYHPDVAFKRWIKAIGDLAMVLIIVTDSQPVAALRRIFSRVGFLLLPASVLLIKYYGKLGRAYTPDGQPMNIGVTMHKNILGITLLVISLGTLWHILSLLRTKSKPGRGRNLLAQAILLAFGIALFGMANCSTGIACFVLGGGLIFATRLSAIRRRPARVHGLCLTILLVGGAAFLLGGEGDVAHVLGRQSNLSGRTEIWAALISVAPNSMVGAGFESFWTGPDVEKFGRSLRNYWHPETLNEAHNGYIETYLNLGWVGVCLIALVLISGYRRAVKALKREPELGRLSLAYIVVGATYSLTEAGFRMLDLIWVFMLVAVVSASVVAAGLLDGGKPKISPSLGDLASQADGTNELTRESEPVYAVRSGLSPI